MPSPGANAPTGTGRPDRRTRRYYSITDHTEDSKGHEAAVRADADYDIDTDTFVWAAGEADALVPVRRWLKHELGLPPENRVLQGYWRRGDDRFDHHAPLDPADPD